MARGYVRAARAQCRTAFRRRARARGVSAPGGSPPVGSPPAIWQVHGNDERCTFAVLRTTILRTVLWDTEGYWDHVTINGTSYSGSVSPAGVRVTAGTSFTWHSDGSVRARPTAQRCPR